MPEPMRVLLISDQPIDRAGLAALLAGVPTINLVGSVILQAAAESIGALRPHLVLWHESAMRGVAASEPKQFAGLFHRRG